MSEFWLTLSFSLIPLLTAFTFSVITPPLGATLSLRNEILLGIALPPVGSAVIAAAIILGVPPEATLILYLCAAFVLFLVMILLPLNVGKKRISMRRRELILAALFCIGNTLTMLLMSLSPIVESHFKNLLQGELLAVNRVEFFIALGVALILLIAGIKYRGYLYAYSLDEEGLRIKEKSYNLLTILYRTASTLIITGGLVLTGPLLTTSLLIVPAFLVERSCRGLDRFVIFTILVGALGTVSGFIVAILVDLPPAPVAVSMIIILGFCARMAPGKR